LAQGINAVGGGRKISWGRQGCVKHIRGRGKGRDPKGRGKGPPKKERKKKGVPRISCGYMEKRGIGEGEQK